jgi:hypothetical protein
VKSTLKLVTILVASLAAEPAFAQRIDIHLEAQPEVSGGCPARVHFRGEIRTFEPLRVTYQWVRSDGAHSEHTVTFGKPGPHPISDLWTLSGTYSGWQQLVIVEPKRLQTIKAKFSVNCGR